MIALEGGLRLIRSGDEYLKRFQIAVFKGFEDTTLLCEYQRSAHRTEMSDYQHLEYMVCPSVGPTD